MSSRTIFTAMIVFPPAKINIGLFVTEKRQDGYHLIQSVFAPVPLTDALEVIPNERDSPRLFLHGNPIPGDISQNLVLKAWYLLNKEKQIPGVDFHLLKHIPTGAGLGGGSSDGAYALRILNDLFSLDLSKEQLAKRASLLGSDCPFFIEDSPALVTGTGEIVQPLEFSLKPLWIVILHNGLHISTAEAFGWINPSKANNVLQEEIMSHPPNAWADKVWNDFEKSVISRHPEIGEMLEELRNAGAEYVQMSGSGSAVFGIFNEEPSVRELRKPERFCFCGQWK